MRDTPQAPRVSKSGRETCKAMSKQTGRRCGNWPERGHLVCKFHGSRTPNAQKNAERRRAEEKLSEMAESTYFKLSAIGVGNPLEELQKLAGEVVAWKNILRRQVAKLEERYRYEGEVAEQVRGEVILFERALDRCASVLGLIAKLGIDDRLARIEEAKVTKITDAVGAALDALGLSVQQQSKARAEVARHLRSVS